MGQICCPKSQQVVAQEIETEKEITFPAFNSKGDKDFSKLETNYNLLRDMSFADYVMSLTQFSMDNATVPDDYSNRPKSYSRSAPYYNEHLSSDLFQSFIENKILKHPQIYTKAGENETLAGIFKQNLLNIQKGLITKLDSHKKAQNLEPDKECFKKSHAMAIGLIYCSGSNVSKVRFLFNLFQENDSLAPSEEFKDFLLSLFLIPSYSLLYSRNKLASQSEIGEFPKDKMKELLDCCELKDSVNLVEVACKEIFISEQGIRYSQFKELFERKESSLGWILTAKGIRENLEKNNV